MGLSFARSVVCAARGGRFRGVRRILITGMSGTGKSTVVRELARRGHRVVDTDEDDWSVELPLPDGSGVEQLWWEDRMTALLAEDGEGTLFVSGCVANQGKFRDRFDAVVLLSVPEEVLLERIETRPTNPFGKDPAERERILRDLATVEPLLRRSASIEIMTDRPLREVVAAVEYVAGVPP